MTAIADCEMCLFDPTDLQSMPIFLEGLIFIDY